MSDSKRYPRVVRDLQSAGRVRKRVEPQLHHPCDDALVDSEIFILIEPTVR